LPEGYDRLVCVGGERFLSMREERLAGDKATRSVVRTLGDRQLSPPVVLRAAMPGDQGFYELNVTSDGKRCAWSGPRDPPDRLRVEVHDLETHQLLQRIPLRPQRNVWHYVANLSHGGRFLWYFDDRGIRRLDVDSSTSDEVPELPHIISEEGGWLLLTRPNPLVRNNIAIVLQAAAETRPWLRLINPGQDALASSSIQFDPRGRYLVWGGLGGGLTLADLDRGTGCGRWQRDDRVPALRGQLSQPRSREPARRTAAGLSTLSTHAIVASVRNLGHCHL
jgi:hypothetical protein